MKIILAPSGEQVTENMMLFFLNLCKDLFPEGIAFVRSGVRPIIATLDQNGNLKTISDPTATICLELPRNIIRLATGIHAPTRESMRELAEFITSCDDGERREIYAAKRIDDAAKPFSIEFMEIVRYFPPSTV